MRKALTAAQSESAWRLRLCGRGVGGGKNNVFTMPGGNTEKITRSARISPVRNYFYRRNLVDDAFVPSRMVSEYIVRSAS